MLAESGVRMSWEGAAKNFACEAALRAISTLWSWISWVHSSAMRSAISAVWLCRATNRPYVVATTAPIPARTNGIRSMTHVTGWSWRISRTDADPVVAPATSHAVIGKTRPMTKPMRAPRSAFRLERSVPSPSACPALR